MTQPNINGAVPLERLQQALAYCPDDGKFTWKITRNGRCKAGRIAGKLTTAGYVQIRFAGRAFSAHRLAWAFHYGCWPASDVDHINRVSSDNRIANLRLATQSQNNANQGTYRTNRHGTKGITPLPSGKWQAQIQVNGKNHYLGAFPEKDQAAAAYLDAARKHFGEFATAGAPP